MPYTRFRKTHPDYLAYISNQYELHKVPPGLASGIKGLIGKFCNGNPTFRWAVDEVRSAVPMEAAKNSNRPWLDSDLDEGMDALAGRPLPQFMDAVAAIRDAVNEEEFDELLESLCEQEAFGYYIESDKHNWTWELRDTQTQQTVIDIQDAIRTLGDVCLQASQHFEQAKRNLIRENERARKDAVRDSLSAVESLYKTLSGESDIVPAWKKLRDDGRWGGAEVVKDGYVIWSQIQLQYPDIRHGQADSSAITHEEAQYWIERLIVFAKYMAKRAREIE